MRETVGFRCLNRFNVTLGFGSSLTCLYPDFFLSKVMPLNMKTGVLTATRNNARTRPGRYDSNEHGDGKDEMKAQSMTRGMHGCGRCHSSCCCNMSISDSRTGTDNEEVK